LEFVDDAISSGSRKTNSLAIITDPINACWWLASSFISHLVAFHKPTKLFLENLLLRSWNEIFLYFNLLMEPDANAMIRNDYCTRNKRPERP
jgi:hypothetical protein